MRIAANENRIMPSDNQKKLSRRVLIALAIICTLISVVLLFFAKVQIMLSPGYSDVSELQKVMLVAAFSCTGLCWYFILRPPPRKLVFWLVGGLVSIMFLIVFMTANLPEA